ncbi:glycosyltransferase family 2 protein [Winogradskyella ursingii]|uniref:glycosyltransferase family 2 protein n=1 Tax=Winogradskyella ursingii TaxID=2686079 RepID=UPI0015CBC035|nr:glycosyltransferase family 2 protein [Winogradskyella ursingii]
MKTALVSILIPFKNTEKYIGDCISSIINQTYDNWECIMVNDNSTDSATEIVKEFTKKDHRIICLKNSGNGIIDALRTAFQHSKGEFITRMDSDDLMVENRLEAMTNDLVKNGKQHIALGLVKYFREDGLSDGYAKYETWLNQLSKTGQNFTEIYKECVIPSPCWMVYREDFIACGAFDHHRYPEDYDLAFRFYEAGYKCIPTNKTLLRWRDYNNRTSRTHEHYAQNYFLDIKVHYFLELDYNHDRPLTLWGAGKKGKTVAKLLLEKNILFKWICDNPKKIGKHIYGQEMYDYKELKSLERPQTIVTVANSDAQIEIKRYFAKQRMIAAMDYFFFC